MPENQTTQPFAAVSDRPCGETKRVAAKDELEAQYRRIGIASVAAAAGACASQRGDGRKKGGR